MSVRARRLCVLPSAIRREYVAKSRRRATGRSSRKSCFWIIFSRRGSGPLGDLDTNIKNLEQTIRQQPVVNARFDELPQEISKLRGQLKDAIDSRADAREKADKSSGADNVPSLLLERKAEAAVVNFQDIKQRRRSDEGEAPKEVGMAARAFGAPLVLRDALAPSREAVTLNPDRVQQVFRADLELDEPLGSHADMAAAYRNLAALDVKRGDFDRAAQKFRKVLELNMSLWNRGGMAAAYTDLGNISGIRGDFHGAMEMYRNGQYLYESLGAGRA